MAQTQVYLQKPLRPCCWWPRFWKPLLERKQSLSRQVWQVCQSPASVPSRSHLSFLLVNICDNRRGEWACLLMGGRRAIYLVCKPGESLINVRADTISSSLLALGTHRDDERILINVWEAFWGPWMRGCGEGCSMIIAVINSSCINRNNEVL